MAIALIDHVGSVGAPNGGDTSTNSRTTNGSVSLIVIHVAYDGASNFTQVPFDSKSNIYTPRQRQRNGDNVSQIYDCASPTTGSGHYFSISAVGSYSSLQAAWFSGTDTTPFDATNGSTSSGSTAPTLSVTPGQPGELIVAGLATDGGSSYSATSTSGNTFVVTDSNAFASATCYGAALAYTIQTGSAVAESVTWSGTSSLNAATIATYKAAATGGNSIAVPAGSLTLTGNAPTVNVTANQSIAVPAGALTLTGFAPSISNPNAVAVPAGALTLTGYAPTVNVSGNQTIAVPAGSLTLTGNAPTIVLSQNIAVPAGSLTLTGFAPTVNVTANQSIAVPAGSLTLTGYAPRITGNTSTTDDLPAAVRRRQPDTSDEQDIVDIVTILAQMGVLECL